MRLWASIKKDPVLLISIIVTIVLRVILGFRSPELLTERPYQEDSFYVFQCAWHVAQGHGFTVDGIQPTNGVQPLIVLFYALFFYLFSDKWFALSNTFILVALLDVLSLVAIYNIIVNLASKYSSIVKRTQRFAVVLWSVAYAFLQHNANGLETGLYCALLLSTLWYYSFLLRREREGDAPSLGRWALLGVFLGLTVLARIDGAIIVAAFASYELVRGKNRIVSALTRAGVFSVIAVLVSSPWWVYNYRTFGSLMPISGQSESIESLFHINLYTTPQVLGDILSVLFYTPFNGIPIWAAIVWPLVLASIYIVLIKKFDLVRQMKNRFNLQALIPILLGSIALIIYYTFFFSAPHFISRYLHPLRITVFILFSIGISILLESLKTTSTKNRWILTVFASITAMAFLLFNTTMYLRAFTTDSRSPAYFTGLWARTVAPAKVGMTSSGTASFVSDNVVNLDGKVNYQALVARKRDGLAKYIIDNNITYVADWREGVEKVAQDAATLGVTYSKVDSIGPILIYRRVP